LGIESDEKITVKDRPHHEIREEYRGVVHTCIGSTSRSRLYCVACSPVGALYS
jgi:hypothetical protein